MIKSTNHRAFSELGDNVRAQYLLLVMQIAYPMMTFLLIIESYGLNAYGKFAQLLVICSIVAVIVDFGAITYAPRILSDVGNGAAPNRRFAGLILFRLLISQPVGCIALYLMNISSSSIDRGYAAVLVFVTMIAAAFNSQAKYFASRKLKSYARIAFITRAASFFLIIIFALLHVDLHFLIAVYISSFLLLSVFSAEKDTIKLISKKRSYITAYINAKSIVIHGGATVIANLTLQVPYLIAGIILPPIFIGALHLGGVLMRAAASISEPVGLVAHAITGHLMRAKNIEIRTARLDLDRIQLIIASVVSIGMLGLSIFLRKQELITIDSIDLISDILRMQFFLPVLVATSSIFMLRFVAIYPRSKSPLIFQVVGLAFLSGMAWCLGMWWGALGIARAVVVYEAMITILYATMYYKYSR